MATGRIGVTPTLGVRWSKAPASGTTSLSGLDDSSVSLVYSVGYEQVYRNGVLLSRGNDYTATDGTTVTLTEATIAGDLIEIFAQQLVPLTDAISKGQFTAKGALLSATAASTPGVLGVGANDTVLTADSTTSTGLKWATPATATSFALLNAGGTTLTGANTVTVSGLSGYNKLFGLIITASSASASSEIDLRLNADSTTNYKYTTPNITAGSTYNASNFSAGWADWQYFELAKMSASAGSAVSGGFQIDGANSSGIKTFTSMCGSSPDGSNTQVHKWTSGIYTGTSVISSISLLSGTGNFDGGTLFIYGA